LSQGNEIAAALRTGNREFAERIDETAAFVSLTERVRNQRPRARRFWLAVPAVALLALVALVSLRSRQPVPIAAEPVSATPSARALRAQPTRDERAARPIDRAEVAQEDAPRRESNEPRRAAGRAKAPRSAEGARQPLGSTSATRSVASASSSIASPVSTTTARAAEREASPSAPDCLAMAREGETRDAEHCFAERARGSGLGAEMALYELGRLRRNVLGDPSGALQALEQHMARFPSGSLRREVEMSHLELLVQVGRSGEALDRSRAMLASRAGGERARELYLLRGDVFRRSLHDLPAAEREYAQAERLAGPAEAEATYLRGVCLEGMGETVAAAAAYRRYLAKPSRPRAADVERRLERLEAP
jgi:hypothetical protein